MSDTRSILLLCRTTKNEAGNVAEHVRALSTLSRHDVHTFNPVDRPDAAKLLDLDEFDAVVVHYTIPVVLERYFPAVLREKLAAYRGLKVQFIQDEYRWIDLVTAAMRELGISLLFTCVPESEVPKVYGSVPGLETITTLPGYVPDHLVKQPTRMLLGRPIDVGYRGRTVPYWLGRLGWDKAAIGIEFRARCESSGLRCDVEIDERRRIYGDAWIEFVASCKATLGTESGASIADFDGTVEAAVKDYLGRYPDARFADVERDVLAHHEGNVVINTISSRMFEAAALRTALILFPGQYSGAIEPWEHYLPLEKDFSNFEDIAVRLRNPGSLIEVTERAHAHLIASGRYSLAAFVRTFDDAVAARSAARSLPAKPAYSRARRRRLLPAAAPPPRARFLAGKAMQPFVMTGLVLRDPDVRRLGLTLARERRVPIGRLAGDLWRLAALRRGVARGLFRVEPKTGGNGRLVLQSTIGPLAHGQAPGEPLSEIVWNHSLVAETVPLVGDAGLPSYIGQHGIAGAHLFPSLGEAWRHHPPVARAVLAPILGDADRI